MTSTGSFELAWRDLRPRVERLLWSKGVGGDVADDVAQETAIKLYSNWGRVDPERPLWPLARTIAINCLADHFRIRAAEPVADLPDEAAPYDLEEHGLARVRLTSVASAMGTLRSKDRSLLLAEVDQSPGDRSTSAYKMARLRARRRLAHALERSAAAFGGVPVACRRMALWFRGSPGGESYATALTGAAVAATIAVATVGPQLPHTPRPHDARKARLANAVRAHADAHRAERGRHAGPERRRAETPGADVAKASAERAPEATPGPTATPPPETKVAEAGGRTAKTGGDERYRYVVVCAEDSGGPADRDLTVAYGDEESYDETSQDHCD